MPSSRLGRRLSRDPTFRARSGRVRGTVLNRPRPARESDAVAAHYVHSVFWDYYRDVHGRTGAFGDGRAGCSRVHYGNHYLNAFYGNCMTYGDGTPPDGPLTRTDIGVHEMTHRVTAATANLAFSGESAGLNEATSDVFAAAAEFHAANPADPGDYLIAENTVINGSDVVRRMDRPSRDGHSKDYWYAGTARLTPRGRRSTSRCPAAAADPSGPTCPRRSPGLA
ncbi:M4 family metallopeptidase [Streptomyces sichuanensis]|uniref:M4 family metallopeptidase n=1 Tax=Streptomyces sichuanensis TaxID=2871810 RepID=UPI0027E042DD|nr:M4 family metallopeptidase [Streptomyces sichuanensis]